MITIQDVAKRAGVAPITVSRVINNSGYVTQDVRGRVEAAIAELGYVPNSLARSLRSRRTNTLALVITDITNPFFTTVARGVEDAASDAGYMVILCNTDENEAEERKYLRMLLQQRVDGILLVPASNSVESLRLIQQQETTVVVLDRRIDDAQADIVRSDSVTGAYELGKLLASLGHEKFAILSGPRGVSTADDRILGFLRAVKEIKNEIKKEISPEDVGKDLSNNLNNDPNRDLNNDLNNDLNQKAEEAAAASFLSDTTLSDAAKLEARVTVYYGEYTQESGEMLALKALAAPVRPTALFAANNFIAIGALRALREAGYRVPEEVALVSFDDLPSALVTFPFLTAASQSAYTMGQKAVALLLNRLQGRTTEGFEEIVLPTELIIRASSGNRI